MAEKAEDGTAGNGRNGKISLWPMSFEEALKRALQAPPPPNKGGPKGNTQSKNAPQSKQPAQSQSRE